VEDFACRLYMIGVLLCCSVVKRISEVKLEFV